MRVLIVDDSMVMRRVVERTLREAGFDLSELLEASNGELALQILRDDVAASRSLDLIISDINMPVMNGVRFLERKHSERLAEEVPVLMIATEACRPMVLEALAAGAKAYIGKPFTSAQVKSQVEHLVHPI